jgi:glucose/arabinose dehydrogenase
MTYPNAGRASATARRSPSASSRAVSDAVEDVSEQQRVCRRRRLGWAALGALVGAAVGATLAYTSERSASLDQRDERPSALELVEVASGLDGPTNVEFRPGDPVRLYVTEQAGRIRVVEAGAVRSRPFLDLRRHVLSGGERGLLGLAFPPDHARTGLFYVHYTNRAGDTRVVELRARGDVGDPRPVRTLLAVDQPYENHNGGQLVFDPAGRLLLGLGDGGSAFDPERRGQDLGTPLAKIRRLDVRRPGARWETVAYGLRNPWRFSFDRATGDLWIADVGQDAQEEIDVLPAGERGLVNFGWSAYEGTRRNRGHALNRRGRLLGPVAVYGRRGGCSVSGGFVYRGRALAALRGRYLYGDLCTGTIWSVRRRDGRSDVRREPIELPLLTTFGQDERGELYAASHDGRLVALRPATGRR